MNGEELRNFRRARGWRQRDLAERIGIDQPTVSEMERGMRPVPAEVVELLGYEAPSADATVREGEPRESPEAAAPPGDVPPRAVPPPPDDSGEAPSRRARGKAVVVPLERDLSQLEARVLKLIQGEEISVAVAGAGETELRYETAHIPGLADVISYANEFDGAMIRANAVPMTKAWVNLARESPRVRRALEALTAGGAWRGVITATAPVIVAILLNHGLLPAIPGLSFGPESGYPPGDGAAASNGAGAQAAGGWSETAKGSVG